MKKDYQIAEHRIRIEGDDAWIQAVSSLDGFKPFEVEPEGEPLAWFMLTDEKAPQLIEAQYETGVDDIVDVFGRYEEGYVFVMTPQDDEPLCLRK